MTNACPARYRGLTPAAECQLRSIRLHYDERPGALPGVATPGTMKYTDAEFRAKALAACPCGRSVMLNLLGYSARAKRLLDAMVADGSLLEAKKNRMAFYRVPG